MKKNVALPFNAIKVKDELLQYDIKIIERFLEVFNQMKSIYYIDYITFESMVIKTLEEIVSEPIKPNARRRLEG